MKMIFFFFFFNTRLYPISITEFGNSRSHRTDPIGPSSKEEKRKGEAYRK
jgi:hypothetical protein